MASTCASFDGDLEANAEAETTMMPRRLRSSLNKGVSFESGADITEVLPGPTTFVASTQASAPSPVVIGGSISALWHDPSYSFSARFARQAARLAAEDARDPSFTADHKVKPTAEQRVGATKYLQELVLICPWKVWSTS